MGMLTTFDFETKPLRLVDRNGDSWFVAGDAASILGYGEAKDLTRTLDDDEKGRHRVPTPGGEQEVAIISEAGLYRAIVQRRATKSVPADVRQSITRFQRWVFHEVLPSIRRTGAYEATAQSDASVIADELGPAARRTIGGIVKSVVPGLLAEALTLVLPDLLKAHLEADERAVAVGYKPALLILIERKVPARKRRAFSQKVSARLRRFSADHGYATRISRESGRYLFQVEAINAWLVYEGERMIRDHVAALTGQGVLHLVQP